MAAIVPISGTQGRISLGANNALLESWTMPVQIDNERYAHFGITADAEGVYWKPCVTGFAEGTASCSGKFDNTAAAYLPSDKDAWIGKSGTGYLGYSATVGFEITYTIDNVTPGQSVSAPYGTYDFSLQITSAIFTSAHT